MGLFDFFKKKDKQPKADAFAGENAIETALRKAATEPAYRAEFYNYLLNENLIVLQGPEPIPDGTQIIEKDTKVQILQLPDGRLPVFTSTARIFDKGVVKEEHRFLEIKGRDLFGFTTGATFILNPYSDYGKELVPNEIESLLKGTILEDNHKVITFQKETQVQIGQPSEYPTEIVRSLKTLFAERPAVKAGYLAWIFDPSSGEAAHYIFALDIEGEDKQKIANEAGFTAQQLSRPNEFIDFMQISHEGGISDYFLKQTTPFYVR